MKKTFLIAVGCICTLPVLADGQVLSELSMPPNGDNQRAEVSQWIGPVKISIEYHSPNVHGGGGADRTGHIWGEVIHYGFFDEGFGPSHAAPWRVGANESTVITLSHDVKIEGQDLKAGAYALFVDVEKQGPWTWIFSTNPGWGSYQYDPKYDALRVTATPQDAPYTEFMTFSFDERRRDSAVAVLQWEKKRLSFKIQVPNVNQLYVDAMRRELMAWPGFNPENWDTAAQFCADNKINLDEALVWANKAINSPFRGAVPGRRDFSTLSTKAAVLRAMQRNAEADALMEEAIHLPGTDAFQIHSYGTSLLAAGKNDKAMGVFKFNRERYPAQFVTWIGLARGYTALGDKENAIKSWEVAINHVPEDFKSLIPRMEKALKKLQEGG
ncbi:MAG: DUF2911 domain-containing protein [Bryobacteraceae bacterium]